MGGTDPDYMVLLSDGAANVPPTWTTPAAENDFYIDVNDNGISDSGDDLVVDFPGGGRPARATRRLRRRQRALAGRPVGLLAHERAGRRPATVLSTTLTDYNFTRRIPGANFRIIDGALFLDANDDGAFTSTGVNFSLGHTDELAVHRDGKVSGRIIRLQR